MTGDCNWQQTITYAGPADFERHKHESVVRVHQTYSAAYPHQYSALLRSGSIESRHHPTFVCNAQTECAVWLPKVSPPTVRRVRSRSMSNRSTSHEHASLLQLPTVAHPSQRVCTPSETAFVWSASIIVRESSFPPIGIANRGSGFLALVADEYRVLSAPPLYGEILYMPARTIG